MAHSVEQWSPAPATPFLCHVPVAELPVLPPEVLELTPEQRPEQVTADRWTPSETANQVSALFPK